MDSSGFRKLQPDEVTLNIEPGSFGFKTTAELEPLTEIAGQPRALRALDLGTGIRHPNYHIYVAGLVGTGRSELIAHALRQRISDHSIPPDWVYVHNFEEADSPLAIRLPGSWLPAPGERLVGANAHRAMFSGRVSFVRNHDEPRASGRRTGHVR